MSEYRELRPEKIIETAGKLERRIEERFPSAGLAEVAKDLVGVAEEATERAAAMHRPILALRGLSLAVVGTVCGVGVNALIARFSAENDRFAMDIQSVEAALSTAVFLGAALLFLVTLEARIKRSRALKALHELRAMAHVIDMHQLTKDPERSLISGPATASSPKRQMSAFLLGRYLDYCSEMLAILSKIAAVYGQGTQDDATLRSVDQVETLTAGLARKVWQKVILLDHLSDQATQSGQPL